MSAPIYKKRFDSTTIAPTHVTNTHLEFVRNNFNFISNIIGATFLLLEHAQLLRLAARDTTLSSEFSEHTDQNLELLLPAEAFLSGTVSATLKTHILTSGEFVKEEMSHQMFVNNIVLYTPVPLPYLSSEL